MELKEGWMWINCRMINKFLQQTSVWRSKVQKMLVNKQRKGGGDSNRNTRRLMVVVATPSIPLSLSIENASSSLSTTTTTTTTTPDPPTRTSVVTPSRPPHYSVLTSLSKIAQSVSASPGSGPLATPFQHHKTLHASDVLHCSRHVHDTPRPMRWWLRRTGVDCAATSGGIVVVLDAISRFKQIHSRARHPWSRVCGSLGVSWVQDVVRLT